MGKNMQSTGRDLILYVESIVMLRFVVDKKSVYFDHVKMCDTYCLLLSVRDERTELDSPICTFTSKSE